MENLIAAVQNCRSRTAELRQSLQALRMQTVALHLTSTDLDELSKLDTACLHAGKKFDRILLSLGVQPSAPITLKTEPLLFPELESSAA